MIMREDALSPRRLVIIGNGMAGARLAEEILRREPKHFQITMIGAEPYGNYNRILLSNVLNSSQDAKEIFLNPLEWYERNGIELIAGMAATGIDVDGRRVELADGSRVSYDALVLATGSRPFVPPVPGTDLKGVHLFRTLDDCTAIADSARRAQSAVVIGGGLLGLEAAKGLTTYGPAVHIVERGPTLMGMQLDAVGGEILGRTIEKMGISVHCGRTTTAFLADDDGAVRGVRFSDGTVLACDMVVISAGIRANSELAAAAGLAVDRGVVVNDQMQTSVPGVYAVGECAQHRGVVYGLVAPIWEQCQVLADHLTGKGVEPAYRGSAVAAKLKVLGVNVAGMGEKEASEGDEVVCYQDAAHGIYSKAIIREQRLVGAILVGETDCYNDLLRRLQSGEPVPSRRHELFFASSPAVAFSLADMPDEHQVCDCNGVSKGTIMAAIRDGKHSLPAIGKCTRAGTGCGSCKKMIRELVEAVAGDVKADPSESWYVPAVPLDKPALIEEIRRRGLRSVSDVLRELGHGEDEKSKMGLASLLRSLWNSRYIDERDSRFINDRVHANVQKDGTFSVVPRIFGGVTSAEELIRIGEVARKYKVRMVKITGGQRIDLLGVDREDLPRIWSELGLPSGHAYTKAFRTCKTCVGSDFCRFGTNDSTGLGIAVEKRFQGIEFPAKLKMAVSGCPRNCAEATVKDIGIVASEGGEWEILVGGAAGASVRKADALARVRTQEEALRLVGRFMQYYREHARYLERTYDFVPRIGLQRLREILVEDAEGICQRLDQEMEATVASFVDPWLEADEPAYPDQFAGPRRIPLPVASG